MYDLPHQRLLLFVFVLVLWAFACDTPGPLTEPPSSESLSDAASAIDAATPEWAALRPDVAREKRPEPAPELVQREEPLEMPPEPSQDSRPTGLKVEVMSFNIRYGTAQDGDNHWNKRKPLVFDMIRKKGGDFLGMQEAWKFQIDEIKDAVPVYECLGRSRKADTELDEWSPLCYRKDRWTPDGQEQGTFWLSTTPDIPGSQSWESSLPRIVTWARLIEKESQRGVYVFNTHFDHRSNEARFQSARLIIARINARTHKDEPVLLMGDFNAGETSDPIRFFRGENVKGKVAPGIKLIDTFRALSPNARSVGTFNGWSGRSSGDKIDAIFAIVGWPGQEITAATIERDNDMGRYPSDHYPLTATLVWSP